MTTSGDKSYCWIYENGQAVRTEIKTGLSDDRWIEVGRLVLASRAATGDDTRWTPVDGSEQVILGDLPALRDGEAVRVGPATNGPTSR